MWLQWHVKDIRWGAHAVKTGAIYLIIVYAKIQISLLFFFVAVRFCAAGTLSWRNASCALSQPETCHVARYGADVYHTAPCYLHVDDHRLQMRNHFALLRHTATCNAHDHYARTIPVNTSISIFTTVFQVILGQAAGPPSFLFFSFSTCSGKRTFGVDWVKFLRLTDRK